jgi:hypothetical protein
MSATAAKRRRRLPETFVWLDRRAEERRALCATRLQRFWRWRRSLRGQQDVISGDELRPGGTLRLVEAHDGYACSLDAAALAEYFLRCPGFRHPFTRRELSPPELRRLGRKVSDATRRALRCAHLLREPMARWLLEDLSLDAVLEDEAGEALQLALDTAEASADVSELCFVANVLLEDYERCLRRVGQGGEAALARLQARHRELAVRRGFWWPAALHEELLEVQGRALDQARRFGPAAPRESDAEWLLVRYFRFLRRADTEEEVD